MSEPWVSVVTVCRNARDVLPATIRSIVEQDFDKFEYIVVDGASDDGSIEVIKNYAEKIDQFVSEPDRGVYDAMNKAASIAQGKYIIFINAGDEFAGSKVLTNAHEQCPGDADFLYGPSLWIREGNLEIWKTRPLDQMWKRISFSHQSLFSRTKLMQTSPFDLSLSVVSDYKFYFESYINNKLFFELDFPIARLLPGGISDVAIYRRTFERWSVVAKSRPQLSTHACYLKLLVTEIFPQHFKRLSKR